MIFDLISNVRGIVLAGQGFLDAVARRDGGEALTQFQNMAFFASTSCRLVVDIIEVVTVNKKDSDE